MDINNSIKDKLKNIKLLVTGGAGFIGSNIVSILAPHVKCIKIFDNLSTGKMKNINELLEKYDNIEFVYGDITDLEACRRVVKDINTICHQAALGSVPRSLNNPLNTHNSNVNGFFNILLSAKENGIRRIVFASSSSVYGDSKILPKKEEQVGRVLSPYAASKSIDEIYGWTFTHSYDMECIGLRYFNVFGPNQDPNGVYAAVIPKFINLIKNNIQPTINGDGTYSRDFTYIDNVVFANILAMITDNKSCFGEIFNIGAGGQTTILELFNTIKIMMGSNIEPKFGPVRNGDIPHSNANIDKAMNLLDYSVKTNFVDGMKKTVHFFTQNI